MGLGGVGSESLGTDSEPSIEIVPDESSESGSESCSISFSVYSKGCRSLHSNCVAGLGQHLGPCSEYDWQSERRAVYNIQLTFLEGTFKMHEDIHDLRLEELRVPQTVVEGDSLLRRMLGPNASRP